MSHTVELILHNEDDLQTHRSGRHYEKLTVICVPGLALTFKSFVNFFPDISQTSWFRQHLWLQHRHRSFFLKSVILGWL